MLDQDNVITRKIEALAGSIKHQLAIMSNAKIVQQVASKHKM